MCYFYCIFMTATFGAENVFYLQSKDGTLDSVKFPGQCGINKKGAINITGFQSQFKLWHYSRQS